MKSADIVDTERDNECSQLPGPLRGPRRFDRIEDLDRRDPEPGRHEHQDWTSG